MISVQLVHGACVLYAAPEARSLLSAKAGVHVLTCFEPDSAGIAETVLVLDRRGRLVCTVRFDGAGRQLPGPPCPASVFPAGTP